MGLEEEAKWCGIRIVLGQSSACKGCEGEDGLHGVGEMVQRNVDGVGDTSMPSQNNGTMIGENGEAARLRELFIEVE